MPPPTAPVLSTLSLLVLTMTSLGVLMRHQNRSSPCRASFCRSVVVVIVAVIVVIIVVVIVFVYIVIVVVVLVIVLIVVVVVFVVVVVIVVCLNRRCCPVIMRATR
jgi:hypothetical protein